ncbi:unnamed protein product [Lampetra fluviatilis]
MHQRESGNASVRKRLHIGGRTWRDSPRSCIDHVAWPRTGASRRVWGWRRRRAAASGARRSHGETLAGVSIGAGAVEPGLETMHMLGAILPIEGLAWPVGTILRRARDCVGGAQVLAAMQGAIFGLPQDACMRFLQRKRGEAKLPYAFREALLVLGRKAFPQMSEWALDSLAVERLMLLTQEL